MGWCDAVQHIKAQPEAFYTIANCQDFYNLFNDVEQPQEHF